MENSPRGSTRQESDHDYFVNSETTESLKTQSKHGISVLMPALKMTSNKKSDDVSDFEEVEEEIVDNLELSEGVSDDKYSKKFSDEKYDGISKVVTNKTLAEGDELNKSSVVLDDKVVKDSSSGVESAASNEASTSNDCEKSNASTAIEDIRLQSEERRRSTYENEELCLTLEEDQNEVIFGGNDSENEASAKVCDSSTMSTASGDDSIDFGIEQADEVDTSDVSSSFAESENISDVSGRSKLSSAKKPRRRQPPIMIGYKKRRKVHSKKADEGIDSHSQKLSNQENGQTSDAESEEGSHHAFEPSSSEENLFEGAHSTSTQRRCSNSANEPSDKYCWTCHKETGVVFKCLACPRVFHIKCYTQITGIDPSDDLNNFQCPECVAVLRADNINTRSPTLATVNLDQLCVSLKHVIDLLKAQKDSHYFCTPVDTKEFPHYREYIVHPMDLMILEKNVSNKIYGCTEAFLADVKWIVHNSIVFNSKAAKITNVAKNLLKICKREVTEIETCAECYYNSLVRIDTWFIEVCKRPHILVWARLKGYPPWPAKALKCKDNMVDCRFFGAHDKAWVPLKDCFLYSKIPPQPAKIKKSNHLEMGIQELEKHINKLKDKYGIFTYPPARTPYQPSIELEQIKLMLPNYNPKLLGRLSTKYLIHPDRVKSDIKPKILFNEKDVDSTKEESDKDESQLEEADNESTCTDDQDKPLEVPPQDESMDTDPSITSSENEASNLPDEQKPEKVDYQHLKSVTQEKSTSDFCKAIGKSDSDASPKIEKNKTEESVTKLRKFVVVKDVETINGTVIDSREAASKVDKTTGVIQTVDVETNDVLTDVTSETKIESNENIKIEGNVLEIQKINDERLEIDENITTEEPIQEKPVSKPVEHVQSFSSSVASKATKRGAAVLGDCLANAKKLKTDSSLRSVNITENVTMSIEHPSLRVVNMKQMPQRKLIPPTNVMANGKADNSTGSLRSKLMPLPAVKMLMNSVKKTSKILPRPPSQQPTAVTYTNGIISYATKPASSAQAASKLDSMSNRISTSLLDEFIFHEYQNHFKKFFEDTLEKLAGKGDLRAKIVSLQKEIESLKRSQEVVVEELKRDYETQIAELRATSIAKMQFDLAEERLKFELEKERAVKEAKSKQWCSNCQKNANYYCCWNTAYCDFECQKKHWIHHMHVCKNDVKKKTAESSENEPPRIMMKNEGSHNYVLNGFEKPGSVYSYQNSNSSRNFNRVQPSKQMTKKLTKPLLPRFSAPLSSPSPKFSVQATNQGNSVQMSTSPNVVVQSTTPKTSRPHKFNATVYRPDSGKW